MFRKISGIVIAVLIAATIPSYATPINSLADVKTIPADQDVAGMLVGDNAIYLFGNTPTGGYLTALNKDGSQKWLHTLTEQLELAITAGALDANGNIWLAGATAPPKAMASAPNPTPSGANPDGVTIGEEGAIRPDLTQLTLWKVSAVGEGAGKYQLSLTQPVLPTSISVNKNGASIVAWQSLGSLFVTADLNGKFGKPLRIGKSNSTLDKVIRNSDGSSILLGSSTELIASTKAIGIRDGVIIKVDSTPKIIQSVRSGEKGASRNWASATSSLLLGGYLKSSTSSLATITKFSDTLKPTWTTRIKATSMAVVANGATGTYYAAFANGANGNLITLDKLGKTVAQITFSGAAVAMQFNKSMGLYILTGDSIFNLVTK